MEVAELYSGNLIQEAFERLQSMRVREDSPEKQQFITKLEGPEVMEDFLLRDFLTLMYTCAVDFDHEGNTIMCETGGTLPNYNGNAYRVLAISDASMNKSMNAMQYLKESRKTDNTELISELEKELEMPLEERNGVTVINGNRNIAHYDFSISVATTNPEELLKTNSGLLFSALGFTVLTNKKLHNEQYVFNLPVNQSLFNEMKNLSKDGFAERIALMQSRKEELIPVDYLVGFHFNYDGNNVFVRPIIPKRDEKNSFEGLTPIQSSIDQLGKSSPYGHLVGLFSSFIE